MYLYNHQNSLNSDSTCFNNIVDYPNYNKSLAYFVQYRPQLQSHYKSVKAALLADRLEFWFRVMKRGFYKFIEPCSHGLYKEGDSWCEDLGFSWKEFRCAFKKIGISYKTKTEFLKQADPFQDKEYASYYNRKTNQTFFLKKSLYSLQQKKSPKANIIASPINKINPSNQSIKLVSPVELDSHPSTLIQSVKGNNDNHNNANVYTHETKISYPQNQLESREKQVIQPLLKDKKGDYSNRPKRDSFIRVLDNNFLHKNTSHSFIEQKNMDKVACLEKALAMKMIEIWQETIGESGLSFYSPTIYDQLYQTLKNEFRDSLYDWQQYCQTIASSKFLMGETDKRNGWDAVWHPKVKYFKKAYLLWAVKAETISRICNKEFSLGDRIDAETKLNLQQETKQQLEIQTKLQNIHYQQKQLEQELASVASDVERERRNAVQGQIEQLDQNQLNHYRHQFEIKQQEQRSVSPYTVNHFDQEFEKYGWKAPKADWYFECYLNHKFADQYFGLSRDEMIKQQQDKLQRQLDQLKNQKQQVLSCEGST